MGGTSYVLIPTGEKLLTIDGETQVTSHYTVDDQADPELKKAHREFPLAMVVHHDITVETARQFFHDLNLLAVRPNSSLGLAMDSKDPLTKIVGDLELQVPFLTGRVDRQARQLSKRSTRVVTFGALRQAVLNIAFGMAGVQYGSRPAPLEDVDLQEVQAVAKDWLKDFFDEFAAQVVDRDNSLAGTAPVLAAIGAMGNQLLKAVPEHRVGLRQAMLNDLRQVDWTKGPNWAGIAGKFTSKGAFSVGGTKEVGYAVYNVLTDSQNAGYARIRGGDNLEATAAAPFGTTLGVTNEA
jgi:DNA sulfur modification protein DndB